MSVENANKTKTAKVAEITKDDNNAKERMHRMQKIQK